MYDSEGIAGMYVKASQICNWLNIVSIPEANNGIHIRTLYRDGELVDKKYRQDYEIQVAMKNFRLAEESDQGAKAFLLCRDVIMQDFSLLAKWRESFLYNMNYVVQRRMMMLHLLERVRQSNEFSIDKRLSRLIMRQVKTVGECVEALEHENIKITGEKLELLFQMETELTHGWEDWIK